jgi:flap endonuclease-1
MENEIKPCYVFDGEAPEEKRAELEKRGEKRNLAQDVLDSATQPGKFIAMDAEEELKWAKRIVKVTQVHVQESQRLLSLMGIPWIQAPGEAEAQCAALAREGKASRLCLIQGLCCRKVGGILSSPK